jgi:tripartite-type tricarboxylate transporter receptor subunit TctC
MNMLKSAFHQILVASVLALALPACAQDYPSKPIRMVIPFPPGGAVDFWARLVAEKLREKWGQPVIAENRAGAAGNIGGEYAAKAAPDGYTLMMGNAPVLVINKLIYTKLSYDPGAFAPVSLVYASPFVLVVRPKLAANTLQDLVALAKANPGRLNYASIGSGTSVHLAGELFNSMVGAKIVHIPYKGTPAAFIDLLGGQVDLMFTEISGALPYISAGKLRVLAVGSQKRSTVLPDIPAMSEMLPGFVAMSWAGTVAPARTPSAIVNNISGAIAEALKQPDVAKRMVEQNVELIGSTSVEMARFVREENERWGNVIRITGTTAD